MTDPVSTKERFVLGQERRKLMGRVRHRVWSVKDRREAAGCVNEGSCAGACGVEE